jgi:uncharacterized membrane protein (UPF0127 family)
MRPVKILTVEGQVVAEHAWVAERGLERLRGWLGKAHAQKGEGLLLNPASSIHTLGMRFNLDLAFLDDFGTVLKLRQGMKPGRIAFGPLSAWRHGRGLQALELPEGTLQAFDIQVGQTLSIRDRVEGKRHA